MQPLTAPPRAAQTPADLVFCLPPDLKLPALALTLLRSLQHEDLSNADLARLIAADSRLEAGLLRLAHAAFGHPGKRLASASELVALAGFNRVRRLALAQLLRRADGPERPEAPALRTVWQLQLMTAALARWLHGRHHADGEELAYAAALLQRAPLPPVPAQAAATAPQVDHADTLDSVARSVWQARQLAHLLLAERRCGPQQPWMQAAALDEATRRQLVDEVANLLEVRP